MISKKQLYAMGEPLGDCITRKEAGRIVCGGGGGGPTTSTTTQNIPDELKPLATAYSNKAIGMANETYQPYTGQRYEPLNNTQNAGIGKIQDRAINGSGTMNNAEQNLNGFIQGGSNPYLDSMVNKAQFNVLSNANGAAARSGSFGNSGIAEQAAKQMGDVATSMYGNAYAGDQANRLQAINMAPTFGNAAYSDASQLLKAGQIQQDNSQQNKDFAYNQFQDQQNLPYKQLAAMSGVFNSMPGQSSTTQSTGSGGK